jgi:hypothetical protein
MPLMPRLSIEHMSRFLPINYTKNIGELNKNKYCAIRVIDGELSEI